LRNREFSIACFLFYCILLLLPSLTIAQAQLINSNLVITGHENACSSTNGTQNYTCNLLRTSTTPAYEVGACYQVKVDVGNTGPATVNLSGMGVKSIAKAQGGTFTTTLANNDITAGQILKVCWDGTNMQCQNCGVAVAGSCGGVQAGVAGGACFYPTDGTIVDDSGGLRLDATSIISLQARTTTMAANDAIDQADGPIIACTAGATDKTATLPLASSTSQGWIRLVKVDTGAGACLLAPSGGDTLNGVAASKSATTQWSYVEVWRRSTTDWFVAQAVTPDLLRRYVTLNCVPDTTALTTGDGKCYWPAHPDFAGWVIVSVSAHVGAVVSSSGVVTIDLDVCGAVATGIRCSGTNRDLLSTNMTIDQNEDGTETAAAPAVITTANATLAVGEWVRVNIDATGTGTQGLYVTFVLQKP
jgi:hypothetical protein